MKELIIAIGLL